MNFKRVFLIVLDSLGLCDDGNVNPIEKLKDDHDLFIPNLEKIGFLNTNALKKIEEVDAYYTFAKQNNGLDSINSHYEMMGIPSNIPFKTFKDGFPVELLSAIEKLTGRKIIGNKYCPDDSILSLLGERQMNYGALIVYTNDTSDLSVAAHEDIIPEGQLYEYCEKIRTITTREDLRVGRVVARPFKGSVGNFEFDKRARKDYTLKPPKKSILNYLDENKYNVIGIGKVNYIFDGEGINKQINSSNNMETINKLTDIMDKSFTGLCIANLSDFDTVNGKNDIEGVVKGIEDLDVEIPMMLNKLSVEDLLIISFELGRGVEQVILYSRNFKKPAALKPFETLANIGATIADNFKVEMPSIGESILDKLE